MLKPQPLAPGRRRERKVASYMNRGVSRCRGRRGVGVGVTQTPGEAGLGRGARPGLDRAGKVVRESGAPGLAEAGCVPDRCQPTSYTQHSGGTSTR